MSEFHVEVIEIGKVGKHPNADTLSIAHVHGGYPVIFRTGDFNPGDKAVYVPVDGLVPLDDERWAFLRNPNKLKKTHERIKAKKLRGIFSMGILTKAEASWEIGQNVQEFLNIKKYEPEIDIRITGGEAEKDPGFIPEYTDIEGLRKYKHILKEDEMVVLTEKIHGANARFVVRDGRLWCGSHHQIKKEDPNNMWWKVAKMYNLAEKLPQNIILYGEVYGQVQNLRYDSKPGELFFAAFDVFDITLGRYLDYDKFMATAIFMGVPTVPRLYAGPWKEELMSMAEGKSTIADHIREGFVVRPMQERWDPEIGRVILKAIGEEYMLQK